MYLENLRTATALKFSNQKASIYEIADFVKKFGYNLSLDEIKEEVLRPLKEENLLQEEREQEMEYYLFKRSEEKRAKSLIALIVGKKYEGLPIFAEKIDPSYELNPELISALFATIDMFGEEGGLKEDLSAIIYEKVAVFIKELDTWLVSLIAKQSSYREVENIKRGLRCYTTNVQEVLKRFANKGYIKLQKSDYDELKANLYQCFNLKDVEKYGLELPQIEVDIPEEIKNFYTKIVNDWQKQKKRKEE